jgi:hypothetical protein
LAMGLSLETRNGEESARAARERFPWERLPNESIQAYRRFMQYRLMPPGERSLRKLDISYTLANRWAKRYQWTKRTIAYDDHVSECIDGLSNQAQLSHRLAAARLGSAFVRHVERNISQVKLNQIDDAVNLARAGVEIERQALAIPVGETKAERTPSAQVNVSFNSPWQNEHNEQKSNEIVVLPGEQVLASGNPAFAQTGQIPANSTLPVRQVPRLPEKTVRSPRDNRGGSPGTRTGGGGAVHSRSEGKAGGRP